MKKTQVGSSKYKITNPDDIKYVNDGMSIWVWSSLYHNNEIFELVDGDWKFIGILPSETLHMLYDKYYRLGDCRMAAEIMRYLKSGDWLFDL